MSPVEKFTGVDLKFVDPNDMSTTEECDYVMLTLDEIIGSIDGQVKRAKREGARTGNYSDTQWLNSAELALKHARRARVIAQNRRGALGRAEKQAKQTRSQNQGVSREKAFIDAARMILDKDTYLSIWRMVADTEQTP